jgi:hypothetical protein
MVIIALLQGLANKLLQSIVVIGFLSLSQLTRLKKRFQHGEFMVVALELGTNVDHLCLVVRKHALKQTECFF